MLLLPVGPAPWHRLRNAEGIYNAPSGARAGDTQRYDDLLRAEGCPVHAGIAAGARYISGRQLMAIAGGKLPRPVPNVLSEEAKRRVAERVARRAERLNKR